MRGRGQPTEMAIAIFGSGDCPVGTYSGERLIGCIEPVDLDHPKDSVATEAFYGKPVLSYGTGWRTAVSGSGEPILSLVIPSLGRK
jgi:hypothetical protein